MHEAGGALIQAAIDGLVVQTREIGRVVAVVGIDPVAFKGADSRDSPDAVFE